MEPKGNPNVTVDTDADDGQGQLRRYELPKNSNPPPPSSHDHHGYRYHHHPQPPQQQHGGGGQEQQHDPQRPPPRAAHQHPHPHPQQQQPYYHPNYNHRYAPVNYKNYANYPSPSGGGGRVGGGSGSHPSAPARTTSRSAPPPPHARAPPPHHHHRQYHPPVAHNCNTQYDQLQAAAPAPATYQYPPEPTKKQPHSHYQYPPEHQPPSQSPATANATKRKEGVDAYEPALLETQPPPAAESRLQIEQRQQPQLEKHVPDEQAVPPTAVETTLPPPSLSPRDLTSSAREEALVNRIVALTAEYILDDKESTEMTPVDLPAESQIALPTMEEQPTKGHEHLQQQNEPEGTTNMALVLGSSPPVAEPTTFADITREEYPMKEPPEIPQTKQKPAPSDNNYQNSRQFPFDSILALIETYRKEHSSTSIPTSNPIFTKILDALVDNGIEYEADQLWERNFAMLKDYKQKNGDCDVPVTDPRLGGWIEGQRKLYAASQQTSKQQEPKEGGQSPFNAVAAPPSQSTRFQLLTQIGFDFHTPMWDVRLRELMEYKKVNSHCSPPVSYPKLGIWVINQRFNIKSMSEERVAALDRIGFVWNHNRNNRSQAKWDQRYEELIDYVKQNKHCNVPATYRHSRLGTWVGKQREEYKKLKDKKSSQLDKYRIDKLNEVNFQWTLQSWKVISWDDRFEALKKFKEKHGHCKIPRNHPDFGNWPVYQNAQYKLFKAGKKSKITAEKVKRLIGIGFLEANGSNPSKSTLLSRALEQVPLGFAPAAPPKEGYDAASYDWTHQV